MTITATSSTTVTPPVSAAATTTSSSSSTSTSSSSSSSSTGAGIAGNFQTFLTLLTTQLQNQNPLDPLDTNQFTQQLVQFAGVEQQLKTNDSLSSLVQLQTNAQAATSLNLVGATVIASGTQAQLANGQATWSLTSAKPVNAQVTIQNSSGQTVYSGSYTISAGSNQAFTWNGQTTSGSQCPAGTYTMSISATDASGNPATVSTQVQGTISSVDLTQSPPLFSIGSQSFTLNQIQKLVSANSSGS